MRDGEVARFLERVRAPPQREDAHRQTAPIEHVAIGVPVVERILEVVVETTPETGLLGARHALAVEFLRHRADRVAQCAAGRRRDVLRHQRNRGFLEDAGRLARGVAVDDAARRVRRVARDAGNASAPSNSRRRSARSYA